MSVSTHIRTRLVSGLLVLVPAGVSVFALTLLYNVTVGAVSAVIDPLFVELPNVLVTALSIALFLTVLYALGALAANVVGRRFISAFERLLDRLPLVNSIYGASKQVVGAFQTKPGKTARSVVFVPFPHPETRAVGFLTGEVRTRDGARMCTVFIPTTPNPTTGFLQMFPSDRVEPVDMDVDDAFRFIMSAGVLAPDDMKAESNVDGET